VNKMKRYEEMKKMVPPEKPELADPIQYANSMGSQPTAYAELLKICQPLGHNIIIAKTQMYFV
jgi:hypothetical protein